MKEMKWLQWNFNAATIFNVLQQDALQEYFLEFSIFFLLRRNSYDLKIFKVFKILSGFLEVLSVILEIYVCIVFSGLRHYVWSFVYFLSNLWSLEFLGAVSSFINIIFESRHHWHSRKRSNIKYVKKMPRNFPQCLAANPQ